MTAAEPATGAAAESDGLTSATALAANDITATRIAKGLTTFAPEVTLDFVWRPDVYAAANVYPDLPEADR